MGKLRIGPVSSLLGRSAASGRRSEDCDGGLGSYIVEWGSILLRWLHVTAAIAWIGGSFFFMHLDASLRKAADQKPGVYGVSWQVHGGGFYEMSKYTLAPPELPDHLIWHKWQSYWTWMSGFSLLCWVYYGQSTFFLIDPAVLPLHALAGRRDRHRRARARLGRL